MAHVTLKDVTKTYDGDTPAVQEVSFEVEDREFLVIVGPSGCGKSTILRLVAGLEELTSGTIEIDGRVVNDVAPRDRDIAMVFQNYALYPHMTVKENLAFGLKMKKRPKNEIAESVGEAARLLGLEELLERRPKVLSGGQRQRVALGRALVRHPLVVLFDEPLSNLDAGLRVQMRAELIRLHEQLASTVIYVTHDQVEAMTMGDRIVVMDRGRVQQVARPLELYREPANRFVAGFIGSPSMNFIPGRLGPAGEGCVFREEEGGWNQVLPSEVVREAGERERDVLLGVRPEDLTPEDEESQLSEAILAAVVELVEPLGHDTYLTCRAGAHRLVARAPADGDFKTGQQTGLVMNPAGIRLFDRSTGRRI